jgi:hypothetical protein
MKCKAVQMSIKIINGIGGTLEAYRGTCTGPHPIHAVPFILRTAGTGTRCSSRGKCWPVLSIQDVCNGKDR